LQIDDQVLPLLLRGDDRHTPSQTGSGVRASSSPEGHRILVATRRVKDDADQMAMRKSQVAGVSPCPWTTVIAPGLPPPSGGHGQTHMICHQVEGAPTGRGAAKLPLPHTDDSRPTHQHPKVIAGRSHSPRAADWEQRSRR
jgi:hypothetical protein